jgi:hypothetical protein
MRKVADMTTTPEAAPSWREIADQLTLDQVAELESCEHELKPVPGLMLDRARNYATENTLNAFYADVPAPAGATHVDDWNDAEDESGAFRYFRGARRFIQGLQDGVNDAEVAINGTQSADGRVERFIGIYADDSALTSAQAREVGRALIAAANDLDRLA